jgi:hypothetical protein
VTAQEPEISDVTGPAPISRTVAAALSSAALGGVLAAGFELAFQWDLTNAVSRYQVQHPEIIRDAFCGYAYRENGSGVVGDAWLFIGISLSFAAGGIVGLVLASLPAARGSWLRRWAVAAGITEILLSVLVFGLNWFLPALRVLSCQG